MLALAALAVRREKRAKPRAVNMTAFFSPSVYRKLREKILGWNAMLLDETIAGVKCQIWKSATLGLCNAGNLNRNSMGRA